MYVSEGFACIYIYIYICEPRPCLAPAEVRRGGSKRALDPLELEFLVVGNQEVNAGTRNWVLCRQPVLLGTSCLSRPRIVFCHQPCFSGRALTPRK